MTSIDIDQIKQLEDVSSRIKHLAMEMKENAKASSEILRGMKNGVGDLSSRAKSMENIMGNYKENTKSNIGFCKLSILIVGTASLFWLFLLTNSR